MNKSNVIVRTKRNAKGNEGYRNAIVLVHVPPEVQRDYSNICRNNSISSSLLAQVYARYVVDNKKIPFEINANGYKFEKNGLSTNTTSFSFTQDLKEAFLDTADELLTNATQLLRFLMLYVASTGNIPEELRKGCRAEQVGRLLTNEVDPSILDE